ncbi:MAG TPA: GNAT family N-acetyltransferase [Flavobacteriaceae bacterium]|nr:GNAT family N-acetyltransferase [Flavobacteriaceae bacterium]MCB9212003.1 GNAT family N-acetyltransferase [Alteromonas sp.]HPF09903.1 GNAT family N-acetyltransferase [Flavobacteriaceae bacterium]HQU20000.1 GNAT family N-acetyltransferase [Flavobacteriaceae bacterium]HQU64014.1 GNAT family N-acetyltransferase [Flavobacteriaceae bacterium]
MIRKAYPSEIQKIMSITKACAVQMISEGIFQWNEHYPHAQAFETDCERGELYVLLKANILVGCITISYLKDAEYQTVQWLTKDGKNAYIHRLAIHPNFQRQGLAKELMDFAENLAMEEKALSVRLDTFSQNKRNQRFYEARGYQRLGTIFFPKQSEQPFYCYEKLFSEPMKNAL